MSRSIEALLGQARAARCAGRAAEAREAYARALQELTQGMSPRHREAIENYLRNLATAQRK